MCMKTIAGKLVLIESSMGCLCKTNSTDTKFNLVPSDNEGNIRQRYSPNQYSPIIISETEKIEVGDPFLFYVRLNTGHEYHNTIRTCTRVGDNGGSFFDVNGEEGICFMGNGFKILALPEQFSNKHIQEIVDGKITDGDVVLVEYEKEQPLAVKSFVYFNKGQDKMIPESKVINFLKWLTKDHDHQFLTELDAWKYYEKNHI